MTYTIPVDASGRLVLPKAIRERLNLTGKVDLLAEVVAGRIELTPTATTKQLLVVKKAGFAVLKGSGARSMPPRP
jgi:AbrB family looped-hinge helix DNA binding protein